MSEYQYYEFLAIDRPLDAAEQARVRSLSTRARITGTSFVNEYHWGDFRGNPDRLMERYYDAHLYVANWGTHRLMLRLPDDLLDPDVVEEYCVDEQLSARVTDDFIVLDFTSQDHAGEFDLDYDTSALLSAIVGVRAELAAGDLRPLYVAWLAAYGAWGRPARRRRGTPGEEACPGPRTTTGRVGVRGRRRVVAPRRDDRHPETSRVRRRRHTAHRSPGTRRTRGAPPHVRRAHHRVAANARAQTQPHRTPQPGWHLTRRWPATSRPASIEPEKHSA